MFRKRKRSNIGHKKSSIKLTENIVILQHCDHKITVVTLQHISDDVIK